MIKNVWFYVCHIQFSLIEREAFFKYTIIWGTFFIFMIKWGIFYFPKLKSIYVIAVVCANPLFRLC